MPGFPFPCVNTVQLLIGCDPHYSVPPLPPVLAPHVVVWSAGLSQWMGFLWSVQTSKAASPESGCSSPVQSGWGYACGRTHDSGPHPSHLWPNVLLPLIMLGSSSKHEFGSGTVKLPGGHDKAVGVAWVCDIDLDCADPIPLPTGLTITACNTVRAGFTWADFFRGAIQMAVDILIDWLIGEAISAVGDMIVKALGKVLHVSVMFKLTYKFYESSVTRFIPLENGYAYVQSVTQAFRTITLNVDLAFNVELMTGVLEEIADVALPPIVSGSPVGQGIDSVVDGLFR
jgi:hypothetical protein